MFQCGLSPWIFLPYTISSCSTGSEDEDDGTAEFRLSIKVLSDKVGLLSRHRSELLVRCSRAEAALEEKTEQIKGLYTKLQLEKQVGSHDVKNCAYMCYFLVGCQVFY